MSPEEAKKRGPKFKALEDRKIKLTIGFDADVVKWLRSQSNYNALVNKLIKNFKESLEKK